MSSKLLDDLRAEAMEHGSVILQVGAHTYLEVVRRNEGVCVYNILAEHHGAGPGWLSSTPIHRVNVLALLNSMFPPI